MTSAIDKDVRRQLAAHRRERELSDASTHERSPCPFCHAPMPSMTAVGSMVIACSSCGTMVSQELRGKRKPAELHSRASAGHRHEAMRRRPTKRLTDRDVALLLFAFLAAIVATGCLVTVL